MNEVEYLLQCLQEEAAEIIYAASKANRFGLTEQLQNNQALGRNTNNADQLTLEINDLLAVTEMLQDAGFIPRGWSSDAINAKKAKVKKYMEYSMKVGRLDKKESL